MTDRSLHLPVAAQDHVADFVDLAVRGEARGYDHVWLPETWGRDAVTILTRIATETAGIGLGSSILNVYSRSPALVGQTAVTLAEVADGPVRVGIGPSGPAVIEGWHGIEFDRPLRRTREYVDIVRAVTAGETLEYQGDIFSTSGFRLRCDPPGEPIPIDVAAMGPKAVELAGRFADGWHAITFSPEGLAARLADLERGAELGNRAPEDVRVTLSLTACALDDGERARRLARQHLAFYVGAMGTYYRDSLSRQGYEDEATAISNAWANRDTEAALDAIDNEMLDRFALAGTPDRAREELAKFEAIEGLDDVSIGFPRGASSDEVEATIDAFAPGT